MSTKSERNNHFPDTLRELRKRFGGLTQRQFAAKIGVAESTLIRWEKGDKNLPTTEVLLRIIALDPSINPKWLLTGEHGDLVSEEMKEALSKLEHGEEMATLMAGRGEGVSDAVYDSMLLTVLRDAGDIISKFDEVYHPLLGVINLSWIRVQNQMARIEELREMALNLAALIPAKPKVKTPKSRGGKK